MVEDDGAGRDLLTPPRTTRRAPDPYEEEAVTQEATDDVDDEMPWTDDPEPEPAPQPRRPSAPRATLRTR